MSPEDMSGEATSKIVNPTPVSRLTKQDVPPMACSLGIGASDP